MKKIIIFGYQNSGTTILKCILGHIPEVHEIIKETETIDEDIEVEPNKKFVLCKFPATKDKYFSDEYKDYIKIFIIRNPLWVYSSFNKRNPNNRRDTFPVENYVKIAEKFSYYKENNNVKDLYLIRYEDLFEDDFKNLKNILDQIGFNYTNDIFDNSNYKNQLFPKVDVSKCSDNVHPSNVRLYKTWQINQPITNNNSEEKIHLYKKQYDEMTKNQAILNVYPDIEKTNYKSFVPDFRFREVKK